MEAIRMNSVCKSYSYYKKEKGILGSVKNILHKEYLSKEAVKDLSLSINAGEMVGFIGLNGAGKTTTLKMLSGILQPTSGEISVLGYNPFDKKDEYLRKVAMVMGNKSQLWWDIPAIDTFELNREIFGVSRSEYNAILEELVEVLKVKDLLNIQVRRLSLGERMKMELIAALIHSPEVVFLDEPTIGLDVVSQFNIREFLKKYNEKHKTTIILTSHNLDDISETCNRILIIHKGQIICDDNYSNFINKYSTKKIISLTFSKDINNIYEMVKGGQYEVVKCHENEIQIAVENDKTIQFIDQIMQMLSNEIADMSIRDIDIEEIVRSIYD